VVRSAVYAGSFDPVTSGHLDVARRATRLFDRVILAVGENPKKRYLLPLEQRMELIRGATADHPQIEVDRFDGLLVDYCRRVGATSILRGLRPVNDFDFEFQIGLANMDMDPTLETVFLLAAPSHLFISSSLVKEIAGAGGDVRRYVPPAVEAALRAALRPGGGG
jgi:pantetheine-phosphate adenylyltransferase